MSKEMITLAIWVILGLVILIVGCASQANDEAHGRSDDDEGYIAIVLCAVFWPFAVGLGAVFGTLYLVFFWLPKRLGRVTLRGWQRIEARREKAKQAAEAKEAPSMPDWKADDSLAARTPHGWIG